jgi:hypothetical protein
MPMAAIAEERAAVQAQQNFERMNTATREATHVMRDAYSTAISGAEQYTAKVLEFAQVNSNSAFEYARQLSNVKSPSELIELSTSHVRQHLERLSRQGQELSEITRKMASRTTESLKAGADRVM